MATGALAKIELITLVMVTLPGCRWPRMDRPIWPSWCPASAFEVVSLASSAELHVLDAAHRHSAAVTGVVERWQPYAGLVYFHLLLDTLTGSGWLSEERPRQEPPP